MASKSASRSKLAAALALALSGTGCVSELEGFWNQAKRELEAVAVVLRGGRNPLAEPSGKPSPASSPEGEYTSEAAMRSQANGELLFEMYKVVYMKEPRDREYFGSYVDSMNQGASLEGVYNGFTHSSDYRDMETANQGASPESVKLFGEELAVLEAQLPQPTEFSDKDARPLARPVDPGAGPVGGVENVEFGQATPKPAVSPNLAAMAERYSKIFVGASIFTLKRVLGDEALKLIASKKDSREKLGQWYGAWVVRLSQRGFDFGLALRNKPDAQFHSQWAATASEDRLTWEVLNRLHRLMNESNRQKQ